MRPVRVLREQYRAQGEAVKEHRSQTDILLVRLLDGVPQGGRVARGVEAGQKRKRHSTANVQPDLTEHARIEVDRSPMSLEPDEFDLEHPEVIQLATKLINRV